MKRPGFFQVDSRSTRLSPGKSWPGVRHGRETQAYPGQKQAYPTSTRSRRTGTGKSQGETRLPGRTCCVRKTPGFCQVRAPWQPAFNPAYARRKPGEKLSARSKNHFLPGFSPGVSQVDVRRADPFRSCLSTQLLPGIFQAARIARGSRPTFTWLLPGGPTFTWLLPG